MKLTKAFPADQYASALESWSWLEVRDKVPVLATLFGDVIFRSADGVWFLSVLEGTLTREWVDTATANTALSTAAGVDRYLLGGLAMAAERAGKTLGADQVYDFVPPPILGGKFDVASIVVMPFVVAVNLAGQLHDQVRKMPPGTEISGIEVTDK